jgi:mycothiol synthase
MNDLAGYELRAPVSGDLQAVADVLVANELAEGGEVTLGVDFVGAEWSQAGFDLATDAWAATDPEGIIVGYAQAVREQPTVVTSWGVVHPDHRTRGIGTALFHRIEQRAVALLSGAPSGSFRHAADAGDAGAAAILRSCGLDLVRHFWHMSIDLTAAAPTDTTPPGVTIRGVNGEADLRAIQGVLDASLAEHWGYEPEPFDRWLENQTSSSINDRSLWYLATVDGEPAGALTASAAEDRGWIDYLGVRTEYRGRGIAGALLRRSFASFATRGLGRALVSVDSANATGATAVYERVGMCVVKGWDMWERGVRG